MCGIVGYIGKRKAYPILIKGLKRLEYRGYDSAGVAIISDDRQLNVYKTKGKVSDLENFVTQKIFPVQSELPIPVGLLTGNLVPLTPTLITLLPKSSLSFITVLLKTTPFSKKNFKPKAIFLKSSTDTEVLVQLIEYMKVTNQVSLLTAVQLALGEVIGAYAIAILDKEHPDEIIAARKSSPLVVGIGETSSSLLRMPLRL